jgi:hypothetical protein
MNPIATDSYRQSREQCPPPKLQISTCVVCSLNASQTRYVQYRTPRCRHPPLAARIDVSHAQTPSFPGRYAMSYVSMTRLHDGAGDAAATAVVGAEATALAALGLDDRAGGRGDGRGRHFGL